MSSVSRSIFFSAVERYASLVLFFISTAVLARLLTPDQFGIYAVINALTVIIAASSQELGGSNYLVQKQELSRESIQTVFTITLAISVTIGALLFASAHAISWFFRLAGLAQGVAVSALTFLPLPVSNTLSALLRRNMEFRQLAICNLTANTVGIVVSIALAMQSFTYMAPIWGNVATSATLAIMLIIMYGKLDVFRLSLVDGRDIIGFGLYSSGGSLINMFYNLSPQLFLGRILDFASVGLYSRAMTLTQVFDKLITQVVNPVIMPAVVARQRAGSDLKGVYVESIEMLAAVQWPFLLFIAVMARPIILLWLGAGWLEIVPLVRLLCIANMALFAACLTYPVFVAAGRVRDALTTSLISLPPSLLLILFAAFFGVKLVAASALVTLPFQAGVAIYFLARLLKIGPSELIRGLQKSAIVALATSVGPLGCAALVDVDLMTPIVGLILATISAGLCWLLGLAFAAHPFLPQLEAVLESMTDPVFALWSRRSVAWLRQLQKDRY